MLIGHLPAGYLIGRALNRFPPAHASASALSNAAAGIMAVMAGSVFPDLDMIYFYLFDHQGTHHHLYWTHIPSFWLMVCAVILFAATISSRLRPPTKLCLFIVGVLSHLLLDSIVGDIYWLAPLSYEAFSLFTVQPRYVPWYFNFVRHWVFGLELLLACGAVMLAYRDSRYLRRKCDQAPLAR